MAQALRPVKVALLILVATVLLGAPRAVAQPTDLFISEYIEGSSNNKAVEIYNGTGAAINLSTGNYILQYYFNGSATAGLTITLTGTVAAGDVFVAAQSSSVAAIITQADQTNGSGWYNGDDAVVLRKGGAAGPILDVIGQVGFDPGTEWGTGLTSTADNTLRRKTTVCQGDTNPSDAFNPATEWDSFANDTFDGLGSHTASCVAGISLSINNDTVTEGNSGTVTALFTVSLSAPAGPGGVTFDIATADNTATTANNDYVANSLTGQTIPAGSSTYAFQVTVNGDTTAEANETFFVNVTSVVGANVSDGQGTGTINNDDVTVTPIHDIQGPGGSSPIVGASVTTRGIVTGVRNNGFFIQEPDATVDADPATSEGILVFTSGAPPAAAAVGNLVQVTGTVAEFVPTQDPLQPPLTELTSPTVVLISGGHPLPVPVPLTATFPDPAGPFDQLERVEGMRVSVASLTVVGPTLGNVNEANATATSSGVFFGVVTGVARPFREAGIQAPDPPPSGSIPPIPRFDSNPERIRVDSDGQTGGPVIDAGAGALVTNLVGPLDYSFRTYTVLPDPATPPSVAGGPTPIAVAAPGEREFTVAAYNLERFFDTVNDPAIGEPVLTAAAYDKRLDKAAVGILDYLRTPDILGIVEAENLTVLQDLATRISADAVAASQPDPQYVAYLEEGNDVGGIDVGFLVKTAPVVGATPRVEVVAVTQEGKTTTWIDPSDNTARLLNDRPSLVLEAVVHDPDGGAFPVTVIVNHLRSLNGSNSNAPNGLTTEGDRVRRKRQAQAEFLANLVQARQTADPAEAIVLVGDFNAFEFNDGLGDSMGVIEGTPSPDNETAVPGDGVDLVNPDLDNLSDTAPAADRYSFIFDGNAQSLDHVVVNQALIAATSARRVEHPRINADFPETARNDGTTVARLADHDPIVAYFQLAAFGAADLVILKQDGADPVAPGGLLPYTITLTNNGPDDAEDVTWTDTLPAGTTFESLAAPPDWTCATPAVGDTGMVSCSASLLVAGSESAEFNLIVRVDAGVAAGTVLTNTAQVTAVAQADPVPGNESSTATTTVADLSGYSLSKTDSPDPVVAGTDLVYTLTVNNAGPGAIASVVLTDDPLPAGTTFQSLSAPAGWTCSTPAVGDTGAVTCSVDTMAPGNAVFTLTVRVDAALPGGTVLSNSAFLSSTTQEDNPEDNSASADTTVISPAALFATKSVTGQPVPGGAVTYTVILRNTSSGNQGDNSGPEFVDVLPAALTLTGATATAGTVNANPGTNTVTWNGGLAAGASVTITIQATVSASATSFQTISNQGTVFFDNDGDGVNEATDQTDDPSIAGVDNPTTFVVAAQSIIEIPTLDTLGFAALAMLLAMTGALLLRR